MTRARKSKSAVPPGPPSEHAHGNGDTATDGRRARLRARAVEAAMMFSPEDRALLEQALGIAEDAFATEGNAEESDKARSCAVIARVMKELK